MKKYLISIITILCVTLMCAGCSMSAENEAVDSSASNDYISITITKYNNEEDTSDGMTTQIWCYDMESETSSCIFEFATTAQYSLGFYERKTGKIYYVQRVYISQEDYGDQIFVFDSKTGKTQQMTEDIFAVNFLIPWENRLYFAAELKNERATKLGYLNLDTGERYFWRDDGDTLVEGVTLDTELSQLYVTAYSLSERNENILKQTDGNFVIPKHTVYVLDMDFDTKATVFEENWWIRTVMVNHNTQALDLICDKKYNSSDIPSTIVTYSLETKEIQYDTWDAPRLEGNDPNYSDSGTSIYGIANLEGIRGIVECNLLRLNNKPCKCQ